VVLQSRLIDFAPATAAFLCLAIVLMGRRRLRDAPAIIGIAATIGWGCAYVFTRVFVVDLPGL
jgi:hypothetical protein